MAFLLLFSYELFISSEESFGKTALERKETARLCVVGEEWVLSEQLAAGLGPPPPPGRRYA